MNAAWRVAHALLLLGASTAIAADKPEDFAVRFTVQPAPDTSLQRLSLPKEALAALQTPHAADVRVFNGNGQAVPVARIPPRQTSVAEPARAWPIYPIMAPPQALRTPGLSLRIEKSADRSIVRVIEGGDPHLAMMANQQIANLVDTRPIKGAVAELTVDAELPAGEPVALTVTASKDLKTWRTLAQDVPVFRFGATANAPGSMRVSLQGAHLENDYLRIDWPSGSTFRLRGVSITPAPVSVAPERLPVPLVGKPEGTGIVLDVPFATPLHALDIRPAESGTLVPVRISGRGQRGEPWRALASGVVYRIQSKGVEVFSPPIELNSVSVRELRVDPTSPGAPLHAVPIVQALLAPQEWVWVASGPPPFTLAVGRASAPATRLPLASLIPAYTPGAEDALPASRVDASSIVRQAPDRLTRLSQALGVPSARALVLWIVLIGGVFVLGGVAWAVMRQVKSSPPQS